MNTSILFPRALARFVAIACLLILPSFALADVVTDWNATLEASMRNPTLPPDVQAHSSAIVHVAIFDAVNSIAKKYTPLHVTDAPPVGARPEAAAVQAAYSTMLALFPDKKPQLDTQLATSLAQITAAGASAQSVTAGRTWGDNVAQQILTWRANDGFSQTLTYVGSTAPGQWRHTPNGAGFAAGLSIAVTTPFALTNLASFDPGPPYGNSDRAAALATAAYAADFNEIKTRGGAVSTARTQAQTDLALFINATDPADANALVRKLIPATARLVDNARTFALLNIVSHDATIVCFQSKYKYGLWRPYQAVPFADEGGNPATVADPTWVPLGATPPHPEYLSGHTFVISSMLAVAASIFGDDTSFSVTTSNPGAPAITPTFSSFSAYSNAITEARINIGFHFRTSCTIGQATGYAVAKQILGAALTPLPGSGFTNLSVRGRAGSGDETLIAGFVINSGARQMLFRAVGPTLQSLGISGALTDPAIFVYDSSGQIVAQNDNWSSGNPATTSALVSATAKTGTFPLPANSLDAAVLTTLGPGSYTVQARGAGSVTGVVMIEAYEVP